MLFEKAHLLKGMNKLMLAGVLVLLTIGLFFIYSACYISEDQPMRMLYVKQLLWIGVGMLFYMLIAMNDYRAFGKYCSGFYIATLVLLVSVLLFGSTISGSKRWLDFFGIYIQPAEFAKLATLLLLAYVMTRPGFDHESRTHFWGLLLIIGVPFVLIIAQPDLGTALTLAGVSLALIFAGGIRLGFLVRMAVLGVLLAATILTVLLFPSKIGISEGTSQALMKAVHLHDYQLRRIHVFLDADQDPMGAGWNSEQSKIAVGSGGFLGKGYLKGTQNILGFLPKTVAPTDFIFSVIAEERGFVGSVMVIGLFVLILTCGVLIALETRDEFGRLICMGVVLLLFFHAFVNIAMTVGLLPVKGLPLPLLTYGGSFTVVTLVGLGFVQSVHIRSRRPVEY